MVPAMNDWAPAYREETRADLKRERLELAAAFPSIMDDPERRAEVRCFVERVKADYDLGGGLGLGFDVLLELLSD